MHQLGVPPSTSKVIRNSSAFRRGWARKNGTPMAGLAVGRLPLVRHVDHRLQAEVAGLQLLEQLRHPRRDLASLDLHGEVADADLQEVLVGQMLPSLVGGCGGLAHAAGS
jgi:hypothetical protein